MKRWARRLRGALGMGVTWGVAWALVGILIGVSTLLGIPMDWFLEVFDAPLPALFVPGFFCGASFSVVLGIAGRRRRFDELSLPRFGTWGALGGILLGLLPVLGAGPADLGAQTVAVVLGTLGVLGSGSAMGTLALARLGEDDRLLVAGDALGEVGLGDGEERDRLGGG